jgi:hypothetical protein
MNRDFSLITYRDTAAFQNIKKHNAPEVRKHRFLRYGELW